MFIRSELYFFDRDTEKDDNLVEVVIIPLELLVIGLKHVGDFLVGHFILFAILSDLLFRKTHFFEVGCMGNE
jgi:hypothetical protein